MSDQRYRLRPANEWPDDRPESYWPDRYMKIMDTEAVTSGPIKITGEADVTGLVFGSGAEVCDCELAEWAVEQLNNGASIPLRIPRLSREHRQELMAMHPAVTRLKQPHECTGYVTGASYTRGKYTCKNVARWKFKHLKRGWRNGEIGYFCWPHLMSRGVWGGMDEERRTERFLGRPEIKQWIKDRRS